MKYVILFSILSLFSCDQKKEERNESNHRLLGEWYGHTQPNQGTMIFKNDYVFYPYYRKAFECSIEDDSIRIFFPDKTFAARFHCTEDTLLLFHENGIDTCWKRNE